MNIRGELDMEKFRRMLNKNTKLVAVVHVSNSLGTINPVKNCCGGACEKYSSLSGCCSVSSAYENRCAGFGL